MLHLSRVQTCVRARGQPWEPTSSTPSASCWPRPTARPRPAEAEIYTAKAVELMARHGIDEALLAAGRPGAPGATRSAPAGSRGRSVQRGQGPAAGVDGERAALPGGAARGGRRAGRGGHRARVRLRPGAGRAAVHLAAAAGGQPAGGAAARMGGRVGRRLPAVVAARVRRAGAPAAGRGRGRAAAEAAEPAARLLAVGHGPVGRAGARRPHGAGRSGLRRGVPAGRPGPAGALSGSGYAAGARAGARADLGAPSCVAGRRAVYRRGAALDG